MFDIVRLDGVTAGGESPSITESELVFPLGFSADRDVFIVESAFIELDLNNDVVALFSVNDLVTSIGEVFYHFMVSPGDARQFFFSYPRKPVISPLTTRCNIVGFGIGYYRIEIYGRIVASDTQGAQVLFGTPIFVDK